jgi:hypothetical protein
MKNKHHNNIIMICFIPTKRKEKEKFGWNRIRGSAIKIKQCGQITAATPVDQLLVNSKIWVCRCRHRW